MHTLLEQPLDDPAAWNAQDLAAARCAGEGRHLLRLWLSLPNGRALPGCFEGSREYGASYARRMGTGA